MTAGEPPQPLDGVDTGAAVDRPAFDAACRRANPPCDEGGPWTACRAPGNLLVIDRDGGMRACEHGRVALAPAAALETWTGGPGAALRAALADAVLPLPYCGGCAEWLADDLHDSAPPIRDHGRRPSRPHPDAPLELVVHVPDDAGVPPGLAASLPPLLATGRIVLTGGDVLANAEVPALLASIRAHASPETRLELRVARVAGGAAGAGLLQGLAVDRVELSLGAADAASLDAALQLAAATGATVAARFVLAPDNWFEFEPVARLCASHGVALDLCVLDRGGHAPLARLGAAELELVKQAVIDHWADFTASSRPASLGEHVFDQMCLELRMLARRRAESDAAYSATLALPPLAHPWCGDSAAGTRWRARLFAHGQAPTVRAWVEAQLAAGAGREQPWLRALAHRIAADHQPPALLAALRSLYPSDGEGDGGAVLARADAEFGRTFDLTRFGGPWAERLGIAAPVRREPPFAIGDPVAADETPPDVTVLVPSYRHEHFVTETVRSVLAQSHRRWRLLVADDRSPDATADRARAVADPRIEVRVNEHNLGLGNSVLAALDAIDTPYVALLNSDDLLHPEHLATCVRELEQDPAAMVVATDLVLVDERGGELTPANVSLVRDGKEIADWVRWFERAQPRGEVPAQRAFAELLQRNYLVTSSNMVVRTDWLRAQAPALRSVKYCLDWRLFLQAALEGSLRHVRRPLVAYRLHGSNTVWFHDRRRDAYHLEVNRVATDALLQWIAANGGRDAPLQPEQVLALLRQLSRNTEIHGSTMLLNALVDPVQLEQAVWSSERARALLRVVASDAHSLREPAQEPPGDAAAAAVRLSAWRDVADAERGIRRWLQTWTDEQQRRLSQLATDKALLEGDVTARAQRERELLEQQTALTARHDGLARELAAANDELSRRAATAAALSQQLARAQEERVQLEEHAARAAAANDRLTAEVARLADEVARLADEVTRVTDEVTRLEAESRHAEARAAGLARDLDHTRAELAGVTAALAGERASHGATAAAVQRLRAELTALRGSREYRAGHLLWNRLPLGYLSRRAKKWYRRLLDARDRLRFAVAGRLAPGSAPTAVVASTRIWPVYSHTFVYQEMLALRDQGMRVRVFHWERGAGPRHDAFAALARGRTRLHTVGEIQQRDYRHFAHTRPDRLRGFLERVAAATGRPVGELEREPIVLAGCTFARMAELARADYLHSWFFYDQSFHAMQAAWLLGVPRGITAYADHVLDDYPWKLVPLQLELADLVVATSQRIRGELLAIGGAAIADKILVKPNAVDGARFQPPAGAVRGPANGPFELASVSRIEPKKGLLDLVAAVALLALRGLDVRVHVVGAPDPHDLAAADHAAALRARIDELGVAGRFVLHGARSQAEVLSLLQRCRAFVAPYVELASGDKDGIPTSVLEAMACGLPVVATDSGSIPEAVADGVEGLIVPQRAPAALADAIARVAGDTGFAARAGTAARARFEREFDARVVDARLHERVSALLRSR